METVLEGFLRTVRSNLMSIRLEIALVKLESISDEQFSSFRLTIRGMPYPPTGKCCNLAISDWNALNSLSGSKGCALALSPYK